MKRHLLRWGSAALVLTVLSSCGGGGSTNTANQIPVATSLSGIASKGPIQNGALTVWALGEDGAKGRILCENVKTLEDGSYTADIGKYNGNVLIEVSGGTYLDEATGNSMALDIPLRAALTGAKGDVKLAVTPLTELAVRKAGVNKLTKAAIEEANAVVGLLAGGISVSGTRPTDVSKAATTLVDDNQYGLMLAAFSQMSFKKGWTLDRVIDYIKDDLKDDGVAQNAAAELKAVLQEFIAGPQNKSYVRDLSETNLENTLDLVSDPKNPVLPPSDASDVAKAKAFITDFRDTVSSLSNFNGSNSGDMLETPFYRLSQEMSTQIEPMIASVNHRAVWIVQSSAALLNNKPYTQNDRAGNTLSLNANGTSGAVSFTVTASSGAIVDSGTLTLVRDAVGNPVSGHMTGDLNTKTGNMSVDLDFNGVLKNNMYESITFTGSLSAPGLSIDFRDSGRQMSATFAPDPDNVSGYDDVYPTSAKLSARITTKTASIDGIISIPEIVWSKTEDLIDGPAGENICVAGPVPRQLKFEGSFAEITSGKETGLKLNGSLNAKFHNASTFDNCALESAHNFKGWSAQFDGNVEAPNRPVFMAFLSADETKKDVISVNIKYTRRNTDGRIVYLSGSGTLLSNSTKSQHFSFKDQNGLDFSVDFNDNLPCTGKFTGTITAPGGELLAELDTLNQTCLPTIRFTDGYFESII